MDVKRLGVYHPQKGCVFPFKNPYNGATHHACTHDHGLPAWCATRVMSEGTMAGLSFIGFCGSKCEVEEHATCFASHSSKASEKVRKFSRLKTCVFPFTYRGKEYNECAPYNRKSSSYPPNKSTPYCATAIYPNGTMAHWGYCLQGCPNAGPANLNIRATGGKGRGSRCVLPFYHDKKWNVECVPEDGKEWCATEVKENTEIEKSK